MVCGSKEGLYSHDLNQVLCTCEECAQSGGSSSGGGSRDPRHRASNGSGSGGIWHSLTEFERHGGKGSHKKPKQSILIKATREAGGLGPGRGSARCIPACLPRLSALS